MTDVVLTVRELNRATLARQMLLVRATVPATDAIARLVGLQAQYPQPPYIGLWTRLRDFTRDDLARRIASRDVIRTTLMRATLHVCNAVDYLQLRAALQPVLDGAFTTIAKRLSCPDFDKQKVLDVAREYIAQQPRTFEDISASLAERWPNCDIGALRYAVRMNLPLVQVPIDSPWSYPGKPEFTLSEVWLGRPIRQTSGVRELLHRYLAAFGPASVTDFQTWSGLGKMKDVIEPLKTELRVYRDESNRELLDLPGIDLPSANMQAPERFPPEYDNLLLGHTNRTRIIADKHRARVFLSALRVRATVLVDGFVRGTWRVDTVKRAARLVIEPFETLTNSNRSALIDEAEHLVRFVEPGATSYEVRFEET
jgi:hypothetical protein